MFLLNIKLVYKIDSYCLGRVVNYIYYYYLENYSVSCWFDKEFKNKKKLNKVLKLLLENNVEKRIQIIRTFI